MLTTIRNASLLAKPEVVLPHSHMKAAIAKILKDHGFLAEVSIGEPDEDRPVRTLTLGLAYPDGLPAIRSVRRISTPGLRIYRKAAALPRVRNGFGIIVVSTPKGLMTDAQARRQRMGGEVVCEVLS
ncbi:30S ribosomal protein S8 [Candidatus Berkelbacteria bacterium]|nr:30S ribosomal protein S8 [Candidatus Berkelbacteria bacterium]